MNDDLPTVPPGSSSSSDTQTINNGGSPLPEPLDSTVSQVSGGGGISGKEKEAGGINFPDVYSSGPSVEVELPKEVVGAGVKSQQGVSVKLPPAVQSMGVTQTGISAPVTDGSSVRLPLTDREIADGLKLNISSSLRWLAEWCLFQLKKIGSKK